MKKKFLKLFSVCVAVIGVLLMSPFRFDAVFSVASAETTANGGITIHRSTDEGILDTPVSSGSSETYKESDRQWLGLPTISKTPGGRLWCAFQTGDIKEGSDGTDNYDVMYYSDDEGKTWSKDYFIFDVEDEKIRLTDPRLFEDNFGKLWLVLIRGGGKGTYAIQMKNPDCESPTKNLEFGEPIWWLTYPPAHRPTILSNGRWTTPVEAKVNRQSTYICNPDDENGTYIWREVTASDGCAITSLPDKKTYGESQIIELDGGRLMMISRLQKNAGNGLEVSYSDDYGVHWTPYQSGLDFPFAGPSSKFHIQRLKSGNILFLNHESLSDRTNLTAWLSTDDGKTFPYKILLDDRQIDGFWGVSYPEAAAQQGEKGEIYIVYDGGRYTQKEIRMAILTEEDIKAGEIVSETGTLRRSVISGGGYTDLIELDEETSYDRYRYVATGTDKNAVINDLPTRIKATDADGRSYTLSGEWVTENYNADEKGRYTFEFVTSELPDKVQDGLGLLRVYVGVGLTDPKENGGDSSDSSDGKSSDSENTGGPGGSSCSGGCNGKIGLSTAGLAGAAIVFINKKRKL